MRVIWLLLLGLGTVAADAAELKDIRVWPGPDSTRVVFDLSSDVRHTLFTLENPQRVVIDLADTARADRLSSTLDGKGVVARIRSGVQDGGALRVVLDVNDPVKPKSFLLAPSGDYGYRVVVDLYPNISPDTPKPAAAPAAPTVPAVENKPIAIAVDAGHGGEDPGAKGPHGVLEKDVVLAIARKLALLIDLEPGMKPVMIRDGDYYVGLRERMQIARKNQAELFVSIHANANHNHALRGSAVYAVSERGASSEQARWLANKENAADLIGGVDLQGKDDMLAKVLFDISQTSAIEASLDAGGRVLASLSKLGPLLRPDVQQAGFVVLKAPDIPSLLVETAFVSNPKEERLLNDPQYQQQMAAAILEGIKGYFDSYRPRQTLAAAAAHVHVVHAGDTLSTVAQRYNVGLADLKNANGLDGDTLHVGDVLQIPGTQ